MSSYAEPTAAQVHCPACRKQGRPSLYPGYHDLFNGERVTRAACTAHRHPVIERWHTGTAKSNWGTVGHGPVADDGAEAETERPTLLDVERVAREALEEMKAGDAQEA